MTDPDDCAELSPLLRHTWHVVSTSGGAHLEVTGELDLLTAPDLLAAAAPALRQRWDLTIDLGAVWFIDAAGISALVAIHHALRTTGRRLHLVTVSQRVVRVVGFARVHWLLEPQPQPSSSRTPVTTNRIRRATSTAWSANLS